MAVVRPLQKACIATAVLVLGLAPALRAAEIQKSVTKSPVQPLQPHGGVLYSQVDFPGANAASSQNFEPANDAFDNELADDFVVPAAGWAINEVAVNGVYFNGTGPAATVNVRFYTNSGTLPDALVAGCSYPAIVPVDVAGSFTLALAPACNLTAGTYWVSVVANMNFTPNGQWGWSDRTTTSNSPAAWRNPGGGFGTPCTTFGPRAALCGIDAAAPDQIFTLSGAVLPVELMGFDVD